MKVSLGSWAFSFGPFAAGPVPFETIARRLAKAGYDGIGVCGFPPHVTLDRYPSRESRGDLARFLRDLGLSVSDYAADFTCVNPVVPENKQKYLELLRRNAELAADIGSPSVRVDSVAAPRSIDERDYRAAFDRLADVWREAAQIAQSEGVRVVWEFEPGFSFNKPSEVVAMHEAVGHPNFQILFDTAHAHMCAVVGARQQGAKETLPGGMQQFLKMLRGRIGAIHLIDSDGTLHGDETSTHRPFGEGVIDFAALAPHLLETAGIDWWCIDLCFWAKSWDLVESSLRFVRGLLSERAVAR